MSKMVKKQSFLIVLVFGTAILLVSFYPWLNEKIHFGQMIKQTSTVQIIEGYNRGKVSRGFSHRIYNEIFHDTSYPWAEEIPLYHLASLLTTKLFSMPPALGAKIVSLWSYLICLVVLYLIGLELNVKKGQKTLEFLLPLIFLAFPIFRRYAISAMPEMMMVLFCTLQLHSYVQKNLKKAILWGCLAVSAKYYAIFFCLGVFLAWEKNIDMKAMKKWLAPSISIVVIPSIVIVLFLAILSLLEIRNPISDYSRMGMGHAFSLTISQIPKFFSRSFTWIFIKNPGVLLGPLALFVFLKTFKNQLQRTTIFSFLLPQIFFAAVFAQTYIIHDYYSIQISILMVFCLALELANFRLGPKILIPLFCFLICLGVYRQQRMTQYSEFVSLAASQLKNFAPSSEGLVLSDRAPETILHMAYKSGWSLKTDASEKFPLIAKELTKRLTEKKLQWIYLATFQDPADLWFKLREINPKLNAFKKVKTVKGQNFAMILLTLRTN